MAEPRFVPGGSSRHLEKSLEALDQRELALVRFAQRLVATPSLSGQERPVSLLVASELRLLGYRDVHIDEAGNVVGQLGTGRRRLMFNGHLDHVPAADMESPHDARIESDVQSGWPGLVLRGRGSCDMKANIAAGAYAAAFLPPDTKLTGAFVFAAGVQEETGSPMGMRALLARGVRADYGISGEATNLALAVGHRGKAKFDVVVSGRASHASTPSEGLNAVYRAVPFIGALEEVSGELGSDPFFGPATLTVTGIASEPEDEVAIVPSACVIGVDRRYIPGESTESCREQLTDVIARVSEREGIEAQVVLIEDHPLVSTPVDHPLVQAGCDAVEAINGERPEVGTWRFGLNASFLSAAGMPCIGIGAGDEHLAHTSEERVEVSQLLRSSRIYAELIRRLCA